MPLTCCLASGQLLPLSGLQFLLAAEGPDFTVFLHDLQDVLL